MQEELGSPRMRIVVNRVQASCIERAGSANDAVHLAALRQQQIRQIRPVLSSDPGYKRFFNHALRSRDSKSSRPLASQESASTVRRLA